MLLGLAILHGDMLHELERKEEVGNTVVLEGREGDAEIRHGAFVDDVALAVLVVEFAAGHVMGIEDCKHEAREANAPQVVNHRDDKVLRLSYESIRIDMPINHALIGDWEVAALGADALNVRTAAELAAMVMLAFDVVWKEATGAFFVQDIFRLHHLTLQHARTSMTKPTRRETML